MLFFQNFYVSKNPENKMNHRFHRNIKLQNLISEESNDIEDWINA